MTNMGDQHDAVSGGDAKERNQPHQRGHAQDPARHEHPHDAANERQGQIDQDNEGIADRPQRRGEQEQNAAQHEQAQQADRTRCGLGAFKLAAIHKLIALGQRHIGFDLALYLLHDILECPARHVATHHDTPPHVLAPNRVWPERPADVGQQPKRDFSPGRRINQRGANRAEVLPGRILVADDQVKAPPAFQDAGDGLA